MSFLQILFVSQIFGQGKYENRATCTRVTVRVMCFVPEEFY